MRIPFPPAPYRAPALDPAAFAALAAAVPDRAPKPRPRTGPRPRRPEHVERRRRWIASGKLPAALACLFTYGEQAVLAVIAHEVQRQGDCRKSKAELADLAGVAITSVKNALRQARALGLITVEERRLSRWRNATNVVRIVSPEWRAWLRLGGRGQISAPLKDRFIKEASRRRVGEPPAAGFQPAAPPQMSPASRQYSSHAVSTSSANLASASGPAPMRPSSSAASLSMPST